MLKRSCMFLFLVANLVPAICFSVEVDLREDRFTGEGSVSFAAQDPETYQRFVLLISWEKDREFINLRSEIRLWWSGFGLDAANPYYRPELHLLADGKRIPLGKADDRTPRRRQDIYHWHLSKEELEDLVFAQEIEFRIEHMESRVPKEFHSEVISVLTNIGLIESSTND